MSKPQSTRSTQSLEVQPVKTAVMRSMSPGAQRSMPSLPSGPDKATRVTPATMQSPHTHQVRQHPCIQLHVSVTGYVHSAQYVHCSDSSQHTQSRQEPIINCAIACVILAGVQTSETEVEIESGMVWPADSSPRLQKYLLARDKEQVCPCVLYTLREIRQTDCWLTSVMDTFVCLITQKSCWISGPDMKRAAHVTVSRFCRLHRAKSSRAQVMRRLFTHPHMSWMSRSDRDTSGEMLDSPARILYMNLSFRSD